MINKIEDIPKVGDTVFYDNVIGEPVKAKVTWISSLTDNKELLIKISKHNTDTIEYSVLNIQFINDEKKIENRNTTLKHISTLKQIRDNKLNKILTENNT